MIFLWHNDFCLLSAPTLRLTNCYIIMICMNRGGAAFRNCGGMPQSHKPFSTYCGLKFCENQKHPDITHHKKIVRWHSLKHRKVQERFKGEGSGWTQTGLSPQQIGSWAPCETESVVFFHLYPYINKHYIILTEDMFFALKCHHEINKVNCPNTVVIE